MDAKIAGRVIATVTADVKGTPLIILLPPGCVDQTDGTVNWNAVDECCPREENPDIDWPSAREEFNYLDSTPCT
jgi:hypothetical protein